MEVRDFPSIYIFYSVVKIDGCDVWADVLGAVSAYLLPNTVPVTQGCIPHPQPFQPVRIPAVAFPISDEKFVKAVAKLE